MNCTEFKIWIETVSEKEIFYLGELAQTHVDSCIDCKTKLNRIQGAMQLLNNQKNIELTEDQTSSLVEKLVQQSLDNSAIRQRSVLTLSKFVAAAVIIIGLFAGTYAGSLITKQDDTSTNAWNSEFAAMSGNTELISYVFE
jgi:hypothetical protein